MHLLFFCVCWQYFKICLHKFSNYRHSKPSFERETTSLQNTLCILTVHHHFCHSSQCLENSVQLHLQLLSPYRPAKHDKKLLRMGTFFNIQQKKRCNFQAQLHCSLQECQLTTNWILFTWQTEFVTVSSISAQKHQNRKSDIADIRYSAVQNFSDNCHYEINEYASR